MKQGLLLIFCFLSLLTFSQNINNMVVFCNDGEPFTLILNGERINTEPQTRVRIEGLPLKKYQAKVVFKNPKLKESNTTITFFYSCYECDFGVNKVSKKKYKIQYFTDRKIEGCVSGDQSDNINTTTNQTINNTTSNNTTYSTTTEESAPVNTITPTNTILTGPGISNEGPDPKTINVMNGKCNTPMNDSQFLSFKNSVQNLSSDDEKQIKSWAMLEAACITVSQLKQLLNVFLSDNSKYEFAKKVYERTKDNSEFVKLTEVFIDAAVKDKFNKFLQSKKK